MLVLAKCTFDSGFDNREKDIPSLVSSRESRSDWGSQTYKNWGLAFGPYFASPCHRKPYQNRGKEWLGDMVSATSIDHANVPRYLDTKRYVNKLLKISVHFTQQLRVLKIVSYLQ